MIKLLSDLSGIKLRKSHYSMLIKSHMRTYGTEYNFCEFYELSTQKHRLAIFCCFNGSVVGDIYENAKIPPACKREIAEFVAFKSPHSLELAKPLCLKQGFLGYKGVKRQFFLVKSGENCNGLNPNPNPEAVFQTAFSGADYGLWLTDTIRRKNRDILRLYSYQSAVLTLRFRQNGHAFICDLATPEADRGKGYAKELLLKTAHSLGQEGFKCYLTALPEICEFYRHLGFEPLGEDIFYSLQGDLK